MRIVLLFCTLLPTLVLAAPSCVEPEAKNFVFATSPSRLADGWSAEWMLESVDSSRKIVLKRCSERATDHCYFAVDVEPGKYYFKEVLPGANNFLNYPVTKPALWFEVTARGVDYIGEWTIDRGDKGVINDLKVAYDLKDIDEITTLCAIGERKLFLSRTRTNAVEVVD